MLLKTTWIQNPSRSRYLKLTFKDTRTMASTVRRTQPPWSKPSPQSQTQEPKISVYNSLTRSKTPFVPLDPQGKRISWYVCGPTVYDDSHVGHARNYVSTDIIRRILTDYFKFDVQFVMNVTDVDDKIILKARKEKLFSDFKASKGVPEVLSTTKDAFSEYLTKKLPGLTYQESTFPEDAERFYESHVTSLKASGQGPGDNEAKLKRDIKILSNAHSALRADQQSTELRPEFWGATEDVTAPYLDARLGHTFDQDDHTPFNAVSRKFETRFFEDMDQLNVRRPDILTRVTEYGEEIVSFVQRIVENGFAYVVDGSVYFDIDKFEEAGCPYSRLQPWNRGDKELQADGEGALSKGGGKKSEADFALWKASKPGEPAWTSPWGKGRPGWHIECSAMASKELGQTIDIHSGGIDLAFPHHDNELAQSEAYWHKEKGHKHDFEAQWINYFMHMGHLHIGGAKMSKSLKNFTTIREDLKTRTARQIRITFLMGNWNQPMEVTEDMLKEVNNWEKAVSNFFLKAKDTERRMSKSSANGSATDSKESTSSTTTLASALTKAQKESDAAFVDSFDTPRVMQIISELITQYNSSEKGSLSNEIVLEVAKWITSIVNILGLNSTGPGAPDESMKKIGWSGLEIPKDIKADVYAVADLRDELRLRANKALKSRKATLHTSAPEANGKSSMGAERWSSEFLTQLVEQSRHVASSTNTASSGIFERVRAAVETLNKQNADLSEYLKLCDRIRDEWLWDVNVYLEDSAVEGQPAIVRPLDSELVQARREAEQRKAAKAEQDKRKQEEKARKEAELDAKSRQDPLSMFQTQERKGEFSAWDENGLPTKMADGSDLPKNKVKSLKKEWDMQKKRHEQWKQKQSAKA